jgi:hypothetical protein
MLNTRFNRFAQVIEARFSAGVWSTSLAGWRFLSLPRPAGVTFERYLLLGANTPWKRVRLTLGLGISETNLDIKSSGVNPGNRLRWVIAAGQNLGWPQARAQPNCFVHDHLSKVLSVLV